MLIGLTGLAGSGKDTVGAWLARQHGYETYAFASCLKAGLAAMGFPEPTNREDKEKNIPGFDFTWRKAAQDLGTAWGRGLHPDLWMLIGQQRWRALLAQSLEVPNLVITDVRFDNEANMIRQNGGQVWHVVGRKADLGAAAAHVSEVPVKSQPEDKWIDNGGTMEQLNINLHKVWANK